jgi:hypothetical protein
MTEGCLTTLASDMASAPKHRLFPSSAKLLSTWALFASDQRHEDRALARLRTGIAEWGDS